MALVVGNVSTFGLESLSMLPIDLSFVPSGPAASGSKYLLISKPVPATVALNGSGAFSVNLASTDGVYPLSWYTVRTEWLDPAGNFTRIDFPDWKLFVPAEGGDFADLVQFPQNPQLVWVSLTEPTAIPTGNSLWLKDNPNDTADPLNTGDLYQWSN